MQLHRGCRGGALIPSGPVRLDWSSWRLWLLDSGLQTGQTGPVLSLPRPQLDRRHTVGSPVLLPVHRNLKPSEYPRPATADNSDSLPDRNRQALMIPTVTVAGLAPAQTRTQNWALRVRWPSDDCHGDLESRPGCLKSARSRAARDSYVTGGHQQFVSARAQPQ